MTMFNYEISYFSLSQHEYWMFAIITYMRTLQSFTNIGFINERIQLRYTALSIQSSGIAILSFHQF